MDSSSHPQGPGAAAAGRPGTAVAGTGVIPEAGAVPVPDLLGYLAGTWHVERTVRDAASGAEGTFTGTTVFAPLPPAAGANGYGESGGGEPPAAPAAGSGVLSEPPEPGAAAGAPGTGRGLLSREAGTFTWQGTSRPAERVLRFLPGERAGTGHVEFTDGRPFHDLDLTSGHHIAHHPCAADDYRGEFTVLGPDRWRTVWRVAGPAKDQLLVTEYTRRDTAFGHASDRGGTPVEPRPEQTIW
ncbi:DUF6314 family protein [Streptomyces sp. TS71-3]|uniref:DUF6314 family protein n=1 Tax=Streptomyces sp. TS71-3 TaxID=2733862 RepID=UPI0027E227C5|nr:DUF6314 family protein [Streptomyces sp. TS71-3]